MDPLGLEPMSHRSDACGGHELRLAGDREADTYGLLNLVSGLHCLHTALGYWEIILGT